MALVTKNFSDIITFSRTGSTATFFNSSGVLTSAAADQPRFDYNPSTLAAQGLLIEEQRTNSIRNNTMVGAVAGTPGTLPTNWAAVGTGLAFNVVGLGTEAGLPYIDIQVVGTTGGTSSGIRFDTNTGIAAVAGQAWTSSAYARMVAGSTTNISAVSINCTFLDAVAGIINSTSVSFSSTISQPSLSSARRVAENVVAGVGTLYARSQIIIAYTSGVAIDITLRIGLPQLELGAFATSVIPTTTIALTRNPDQASVNTLSPWYNATEGTLYGEVSSAAQTVSGVSRRIANINDGTEADRITVGWAGATSVAAAFVSDNSVTQASFTSPSGAYPFPTKVALAYKAADFQAAVNGSAFAAVSSGTVPTVNRMTIGDVVTGGTGPQNLNGHVRRIAYYPRRLSQAELTAITA